MEITLHCTRCSRLLLPRRGHTGPPAPAPARLAGHLRSCECQPRNGWEPFDKATTHKHTPNGGCPSRRREGLASSWHLRCRGPDPASGTHLAKLLRCPSTCSSCRALGRHVSWRKDRCRAWSAKSKTQPDDTAKECLRILPFLAADVKQDGTVPH